MKSYSQFVTEAYSAREELNEILGLKTLGRAARFVTAIPGLQQAYGAGLGTYRLMKGDKTGAALGYAQALPGPIGWAALAADVARDFTKKPKSKSPTQTPAPAQQKPPAPEQQKTPEKPKVTSGNPLGLRKL